MPNGIVIIDKPSDWTASEATLKEHRTASGSAYPNGCLLLLRTAPATLGCGARL